MSVPDPLTRPKECPVCGAKVEKSPGVYVDGSDPGIQTYRCENGHFFFLRADAAAGAQ